MHLSDWDLMETNARVLRDQLMQEARRIMKEEQSNSPWAMEDSLKRALKATRLARSIDNFVTALPKV